MTTEVASCGHTLCKKPGIQGVGKTTHQSREHLDAAPDLPTKSLGDEMRLGSARLKKQGKSRDVAFSLPAPRKRPQPTQALLVGRLDCWKTSSEAGEPQSICQVLHEHDGRLTWNDHVLPFHGRRFHDAVGRLLLFRVQLKCYPSCTTSFWDLRYGQSDGVKVGRNHHDDPCVTLTKHAGTSRGRAIQDLHAHNTRHLFWSGMREGDICLDVLGPREPKQLGRGTNSEKFEKFRDGRVDMRLGGCYALLL
mmetsp:Transcript_4450/g.9753  ORF Transcript_4450/g.9753 Transcript_4450/m.9753 type:complete len:250 (+) Transcript_4450:193-942(+)